MVQITTHSLNKNKGRETNAETKTDRVPAIGALSLKNTSKMDISSSTHNNNHNNATAVCHHRK
ncbi:MAG: hypothetical protein UH241_06625 [Acutalibacteraceae bacterium]|nr:hypothetical protein [Acutalibacteraceae bacterium]